MYVYKLYISPAIINFHIYQNDIFKQKINKFGRNKTCFVHKDKNYRLLCQIRVRYIHSAPSLNSLYVREHLITHMRLLTWFTQFCSFRFPHPISRQKCLPSGQGGGVGSSTCMFTLRENTSALKEFIISNSVKELTVCGEKPFRDQARYA